MKRFFQRLGTAWTVMLLVCSGFILLAAVFFGLLRWAGTAPLPQQAADRWQGGGEEGRFAQISAFFAKDVGFTLENMMQLRQTIDTKLQENSVSPKENARLTIDAYSATTTLGVSNDRATTQAIATGVGGDFFFFHPYQMMSGQYLQPDELLQDIVLIDWELAWRLYGASDVVGFPITVGGIPCYIGGVFKQDEQWPEKETYGDTSRLFLSYDLLERVSPGLGIDCIETVLPDPVTGFALGIIENALPGGSTSTLVTENSARFRWLTLAKGLKDFGAGRMQTTAVILPYWENAARIAESYALLFLTLAALMLIFPLVLAVILLVKAWKKKGTFARWLAAKASPGIKWLQHQLKNRKPLKIINKNRKG